LSSPDPGPPVGAPAILCAGIIVLDEVFQVERFPQADGKARAHGFFAVNGGCAANAAVAIARLGGRAALAGPLGGPAGSDLNGDRVLAARSRASRSTVPAASALWTRPPHSLRSSSMRTATG
jgi:sugar/nucleoside kinase (ribokinase family)